MNYNQITMVQRYQIEALIKEGLSKSYIAKNLGVHISTIYREINRNSIDGYYKAEYAQIQTRLRYQGKAKNLKITKRHKKYILKHLKQGNDLSKYLRHKNRKYKSRKGIYEYRGKIPRAKSIHLRDIAANSKERIGDFEADTVIGVKRNPKMYQNAV